MHLRILAAFLIAGSLAGSSSAAKAPLFADFDGTHHSTLSLPTAGMDLSGESTIEFWVTPSWHSVGGKQACMLALESDEGLSYSLHLIRDSDGTGIGVHDGFNSDVIQHSFIEGEAYHVALISRNGQSKISIDGGRPKSVNASPLTALPIRMLHLGSSDGVNDLFVGAVGDLRLWNVALSTPDVYRLARQHAGHGAVKLRTHPNLGALLAFTDFKDERRRLVSPSPVAGNWVEQSQAHPTLLGSKLDPSSHGTYNKPPVFTLVAKPDEVDYWLYMDGAWIGDFKAEAPNNYLFISATKTRAQLPFSLDEADLVSDEVSAQLAGLFGVAEGRVVVLQRQRGVAESNELGVEADMSEQLMFDQSVQGYINNFKSYNLHFLNPFDFNSTWTTEGTQAASDFLVFERPSKFFSVTDRLLSPRELIVIQRGHSQANHQATLTSTESQLRQAMRLRVGVKAEASFAGNGGSFAGSLEFRNAAERMESESRHVLVSSSQALLHTLALNQNRAVLSSDFRQRIQRLEKATHAARFTEFFDEVGTHYAHAVTYGALAGQRRYLTRTEIEAIQETGSTVEAAVEMTGSYAGATASLGASVEDQEDQRSSLKSIFESVDAEKWILGPAFLTDASSEELEVDVDQSKVAPIYLDLRPLAELLSPQHFDDPNIYHELRTEMRKAFDAYRLHDHGEAATTTPELPEGWVEYEFTIPPPSETRRRERLFLEFSTEIQASGRVPFEPRALVRNLDDEWVPAEEFQPFDPDKGEMTGRYALNPEELPGQVWITVMGRSSNENPPDQEYGTVRWNTDPTPPEEHDFDYWVDLRKELSASFLVYVELMPSTLRSGVEKMVLERVERLMTAQTDPEVRLELIDELVDELDDEVSFWAIFAPASEFVSRLKRAIELYNSLREAMHPAAFSVHSFRRLIPTGDLSVKTLESVTSISSESLAELKGAFPEQKPRRERKPKGLRAAVNSLLGHHTFDDDLSNVVPRSGRCSRNLPEPSVKVGGRMDDHLLASAIEHLPAPCGFDLNRSTIHLKFRLGSERSGTVLATCSATSGLQVRHEEGVLELVFEAASASTVLVRTPLARDKWHSLSLSLDTELGHGRAIVDGHRSELRLPHGLQFSPDETSSAVTYSFGCGGVRVQAIDELMYFDRALELDELVALSSLPRVKGGRPIGLRDLGVAKMNWADPHPGLVSRDSVIAYYCFDSSLADCSPNGGRTARLQGAERRDDFVQADEGSVTLDAPGLDYESFALAFDFRPTKEGRWAKQSQPLLQAGIGEGWLALDHDRDGIWLRVGEWREQLTSIPLKPLHWHRCVLNVDRSAGLAFVSVDGLLSAPVQLPEDRRIGLTGINRLEDNKQWRWNAPGSLDEVVLYGRSLTLEELDELTTRPRRHDALAPTPAHFARELPNASGMWRLERPGGLPLSLGLLLDQTGRHLRGRAVFSPWSFANNIRGHVSPTGEVELDWRRGQRTLMTTRSLLDERWGRLSLESVSFPEPIPPIELEFDSDTLFALDTNGDGWLDAGDERAGEAVGLFADLDGDQRSSLPEVVGYMTLSHLQETARLHPGEQVLQGLTKLDLSGTWRGGDGSSVQVRQVGHSLVFQGATGDGIWEAPGVLTGINDALVEFPTGTMRASFDLSAGWLSLQDGRTWSDAPNSMPSLDGLWSTGTEWLVIEQVGSTVVARAPHAGGPSRTSPSGTALSEPRLRVLSDRVVTMDPLIGLSSEWARITGEGLLEHRGGEWSRIELGGQWQDVLEGVLLEIEQVRDRLQIRRADAIGTMKAELLPGQVRLQLGAGHRTGALVDEHSLIVFEDGGAWRRVAPNDPTEAQRRRGRLESDARRIAVLNEWKEVEHHAVPFTPLLAARADRLSHMRAQDPAAVPASLESTIRPDGRLTGVWRQGRRNVITIWHEGDEVIARQWGPNGLTKELQGVVESDSLLLSLGPQTERRLRITHSGHRLSSPGRRWKRTIDLTGNWRDETGALHRVNQELQSLEVGTSPTVSGRWNGEVVILADQRRAAVSPRGLQLSWNDGQVWTRDLEFAGRWRDDLRGYTIVIGQAGSFLDVSIHEEGGQTVAVYQSELVDGRLMFNVGGRPVGVLPVQSTNALLWPNGVVWERQSLNSNELAN